MMQVSLDDETVKLNGVIKLKKDNPPVGATDFSIKQNQSEVIDFTTNYLYFYINGYD